MEYVNRARDQWDRAAAIGLVLVGTTALILGYVGVSHTEFVAAQLPYFVSGGLFGLFCFGSAGVLWLSADLRDEWLKLEQIDSRLERIEHELEDIAAQGRPASPRAAAVEDDPTSRPSPKVRHKQREALAE